ncbi:maltose O-acetyltransferase [Agrilactobacillus composti DSM 18527 = JCM 14202]|jgi:maltose O-acetyltransferase|uniref:Acetyltransferase n=1 Tax=Agrilactobacillus composti DSM 18527 = JCM 14202 TaxID=1423734 RepID=X0PQE0_9LACO|nr:sugar O-acetyltransferase [Agrilactobacillus composti]KRM34994.1 maltose O-acetyltransferase [Agrilactobacillus composti DSM 18527 = JCM 14202]MCH4169756.1 sugar O-acetyltransferase [Lactobacillus sp.]GAF39311.1 maltose O-acetyltransferase [Agrilactobacillus composti DSM 18527 = JCM 14202]
MTTNKEKMLAGQDYQILDPELAADETRARRLCKQLNDLDDNDNAQKDHVIRQLFGTVGKNPYLQPDFHCDFGYNIHVGDNFLCNYDGVILDSAPVTIGNDVLFGPHVQIYAAYHPFNPERRAAMIGKAKPVTIGNNVWLGGGTAVVPGVTLGNNVVVGANSVVTKSFGDNLVIAGNPARVIRELDPEEVD